MNFCLCLSVCLSDRYRLGNYWTDRRENLHTGVFGDGEDFKGSWEPLLPLERGKIMCKSEKNIIFLFRCRYSSK